MAGAGETIFALSSGQPPCAISILRISGPQACHAAQALTGRPLSEPRRAALRAFRDPQSDELIDEGLLLWFPAGESVTGEPLVELHCHGSRAVVRDLQRVLAQLPGLRPAEPGDFTRRAFANGRMDLSGVEGLGDLLAAETVQQRRAAMAMMGGALSRKIAAWTQQLRTLAARIEAALDFSDEGDVAEAALSSDVAISMRALAADLADELAKPGVERLREGIRVVIAGPPNAGKSTLLNALAGREAAIVSPIAGTTRDVIEAPVAIGGIPFLFADTAGLHAAGEDPIERIGIERANARLAAADIVLWLGVEEGRPEVTGALLPIRAKADLAEPAPGGPCATTVLAVSAMTGEGLDRLIEALQQMAAGLLPAPGDYALSARQRSVLARAQQALAEGAALTDEILIAECLRVSLTAMDELTGQATTEAVLDELFSGFCIGK